ncbi:MAG: hypothetical protein ABJF04_23320 [Reichenbachiella sp.]|uniref:hypothetical protein n=1 Tax=Reichenbachiella sp. TaxID=2184521 RepID=UPI0032676A59
MKLTLTIFLLAISNHLLADYENGVIYKTNGDTIECLIDVYEPGVLIGNIKALQYKIDQDHLSLSLDQISSVELNGNSFHVLTLKEQGEKFFNEEVIISHMILAKLIQEGEVNLYQYYYSGNSIYENGKTNKSFGKSLHERPIFKSEDETRVIYKMTYSSSIKKYFPSNGKEILSKGLKYDEISAAVIEGNRYLANN